MKTMIATTIAAAAVIGLGIGSACAAGSSDTALVSGSQTAPATQYYTTPEGNVVPQQEPSQMHQYITSTPAQTSPFSTYDNNGQG